MAVRFVIWSIEHQAWWAPAQRGYVAHVADAGLYARDQAEAIVRDAKFACHECMIPVSALASRDIQFHEG